VRWSVSGLGCSKSTCGKVSRVRLLYRTCRGSPILPTVIVQAVSRGDTDTSEVTIVAGNSLCTNLRLPADGSLESHLCAKNAQRWGTPRWGLSRENQKQDQTPKRQNQDQEQRSGQECPLYRGELDLLHFRCLAAATGLRSCCRRSWNPTLARERAKMGTREAGVRLKKIANQNQK